MDWGLAKVLPQGGAVDDAAAGKTRAEDTVIATARSAGEADSDLSMPGSVMGTPAYMAPEQAAVKSIRSTSGATSLLWARSSARS